MKILTRRSKTGTLISARQTESRDISFVAASENAPENVAFVDHWSPEAHLEQLRNPDIAHWIIEVDGNRPQLVGYVILVGLQDANDALQFRRVVITEKGQGFGAATVQMVKEYAFDFLRMHRIWLNVKEGNDRAEHMYSSQGFKREGLARDAAKVGPGHYVSHIVMSILEQEYRLDGGTKGNDHDR